MDAATTESNVRTSWDGLVAFSKSSFLPTFQKEVAAEKSLVCGPTSWFVSGVCQTSRGFWSIMSSSLLRWCRRREEFFFSAAVKLFLETCDYHETSRQAVNFSHKPAGGKCDHDAPDKISFISFLLISWLHAGISWSPLFLPDIET